MKKIITLFAVILSFFSLSVAHADVVHPKQMDAYLINNTDYPVHVGVSNYNKGACTILQETVAPHTVKMAHVAKAPIINKSAYNSLTVHVGDGAMNGDNTALAWFQIDWTGDLTYGAGAENGTLYLHDKLHNTTHKVTVSVEAISVYTELPSGMLIHVDPAS